MVYIYLFIYSIYVKVLVTQLCLILCDSTDCSPPGSSVHGILQARILGFLLPSPEDLPDPGIKPRPPALQADSPLSEPPGKPHYYIIATFPMVGEGVFFLNFDFFFHLVMFFKYYLKFSVGLPLD